MSRAPTSPFVVSLLTLSLLTLSLLTLSLLTLALPCGAAEEYKLEALKEPPPAEVAEPLRAVLAAEGIRVQGPGGKAVADLWIRKEAPKGPPPGKEAPPGIQLSSLGEGTFLGVVRFPVKHLDFKNQSIPPGTYTLRLGIQPRDGDHLGVSETRDFALLSSLDADRSLEPVPTKELVKLSGKVSGSKHPAVIWIVETKGARKSLPALVHEKEKDFQIVDFEIPAAGAKEKEKEKEAPHRLGLVIVGSAPEQ